MRSTLRRLVIVTGFVFAPLACGAPESAPSEIVAPPQTSGTSGFLPVNPGPITPQNDSGIETGQPLADGGREFADAGTGGGVPIDAGGTFADAGFGPSFDAGH